MAGAGYKLFNTGDVLTAQQVNEYLMQQTVMSFADAAARTTALSGVLAEGMVSYLRDTNIVQVYNGSAWVGFDDSDAIQNAIVDAKGDLISATADNTPARLASSGVNGNVLTVDTSTATGLKWAAPAATGINWTYRASAGSGIKKIAYNGTNLWVAVGDGGKLLTSPDATTWTSRTSGFGGNGIRDVHFGNGLWVAVGSNGTITTSSDGTTWTARTSNMSTNSINAVTYQNSLWVAVGGGGGSTDTGGITYSSDGLTWTRKSQSLTVGATYYTVTYNGTNWVVGASLSTNNYLYASAPSGTWTAGNTAGGGPVLKIFWDGTRHTIFETTSQLVSYSTSTTIGATPFYDYSPSTPTAFVNFVGMSLLYNNRVYFTNSNYVQSLKTSSSTSSNEFDTPVIVPSLINSNGALSQACNALWVGSQGYIVGMDSGAIYSSF